MEDIRDWLDKIPWSEGDAVVVEGVGLGVVRYVYYNGFTLVEFPDTPITGGVFNNNSTFRNDKIRIGGERWHLHGNPSECVRQNASKGG